MDISRWTFEAADGHAAAVMRRGSFRHTDTLRRLRPLQKDRISIEALPQTIDCRIRRIHIDLTDEPANRVLITLPVPSGEHVFGCGETFSELDMKGHKVRIWVAEHQNARMIGAKMIHEILAGQRPMPGLKFEHFETYYAQPTFQSDCGYFLHVDGGGYMEFDFRAPRATKLLIRVPDSKETASPGGAAFERGIDLYLGEAVTFSARSAGLRSLLGTQPPLPEKLLEGVILASQQGAEEVDRHIALARQYDIPLLGVWCQDWCGCRRTRFGYQVMWNWQWDAAQYPDLPEKIRAWKAQGVSFYGYINPFLATEGALYREASEKGYLVKNQSGEDYMVTITTFPAGMVDFTNPAAYNWYKDIIKENMIGIGMDGWMADFGEYLPPDAVLWSGEDAMDLHNGWPAVWAKMNREAIEECGKEGELFFFTRAGHTGTVANSPMMWNGDQHVDWSKDQGIGSVIPATLSLAMSGIGLCHSDIGGYTSILHMQRSKELLMRWAELACFSPLMRLHEGNRPDANVQFDCDAQSLSHLAAFGRYHAALAPYLKDCFAEYYEKGVPVMRPLSYHYSDRAVAAQEDEYLLGRDILVAPVLKPETSVRTVRLPADDWVHLFTGEILKEGDHLIVAPIGMPPVFIREKSRYAAELLPVFSQR